MYKITLHYISDEIGVYTKEEETASTKYDMILKKRRILTRWKGNLCIDYKKISQYNDDEILKIVIRIINMIKRGNSYFMLRKSIKFIQTYLLVYYELFLNFFYLITLVLCWLY